MTDENRKGWDADSIALIRPMLAEAVKSAPKDPHGNAYRHLRSKWSHDMFLEHDLPKQCGVDLIDPFHEIPEIHASAVSATIVGYGAVYASQGYTVQFTHADGSKTQLMNCPRWALVIEGEQNWEDVTG